MSKSAKGGTRQNVRVICRVRPTNAREIRENGVVCVKHTDTVVEVENDTGPAKFNFDRIFGSESNQVEVFQEAAGPLIIDVLEGYNATIFAYGQTGTGKTHTMEGNIHDEVQKGIIPRSVEALFDSVTQADENIEFTFKVSYVEIYLEKIRDLLDEHRTKVNLQVREDKLKGIYIADVTEEYVTSVEELLQVMHTGANNRATAATGMNEGSSRSHSVFTITVTQKDVRTNGMKSGKLQLVDLAGSEMVRKTGASGQQLEEAKMINKSLSALGQVINALTDEKAGHVPYRDSKLTRVLQDSLGGNSKTVLIIAVSPSSFNAPETVSTMRFGMRAKSITNKVSVNATRTVEELEALLVRAESAIDAQANFIMTLQTQMAAVMSQNQVLSPQTSVSNAQLDGSNPAGNGANSGGNTVQLEEGKVIVDIAQLERDAHAMQKLQTDILRLQQELEDERADSQRKDGEIKSLNRMLKEKDRYTQEAAGVLSEMQSQNDSMAQRCESLLKEKIETLGELESLKASQNEGTSALQFKLQEMEVTLSTLEEANVQLKQEIAELGGGSGGGGNNNAMGTPNKKNLISSDANNQMQDVDEDQPSGASFVRKLQQNRRDFDEPSISLMTSAERKELLENMSEQFATVCLTHKIDDMASSELFTVMDSYAMEAERSFAAQEEKYHVTEKQHSKRIKDLDEQRSRLERDLQSRIENVAQLQMKFDSLGRADSRTQDAQLLERDRAKSKSLQTRLEQLVAVHRQLLRKFATLELENAELKKKTQLRDDRIRQLEDNSRGQVATIRQTTEKHLAEVAIFREQIQIMKTEFEKQYEAARASDNENKSPVFNRNTVNNRTLQPKSIRGGGNNLNSRSFYQPSVGGISEDGNETLPAVAAYAAPQPGMLPKYSSFAFGASAYGSGGGGMMQSASQPEEPKSLGLAKRMLGSFSKNNNGGNT